MSVCYKKHHQLRVYKIVIAHGNFAQKGQGFLLEMACEA
jgi:hypothetical protein